MICAPVETCAEATNSQEEEPERVSFEHSLVLFSFFPANANSVLSLSRGTRQASALGLEGNTLTTAAVRFVRAQQSNGRALAHV